MDTELIRTFLEVHRTRHFSRAAAQLFVTPAAVSARIRLLEEQVGTRLFTRSRNNIALTAAGQRFLPHAEAMLRSWNRARASVGAGHGDLEMLTLGSLHSIWRVLLDGWLPALYGALREVALQVELLSTPAVVGRVREHSLDLGLVYEPPRLTDLRMQAVASLELVLVSDRAEARVDESLQGYVHVDWGSPFSMTLARELPALPEPALRVDSPDLACKFLEARGGAAYLPRLALQQSLDPARFRLVAGAPVIRRPVYLIRSANLPAAPALGLLETHLVSWLGTRAPAAPPGPG